MIYAFSVIKGLSALQGNMFCHIVMAITMLVYVRIPAISKIKTEEAASDWWNGVDEEEIEARMRTGEEIEVFPGADLWYTYSVAIHIIQGTIQFIDLFFGYTEDILPLGTFYESMTLLIIIAQVYNFILIMTYFCLADPFEDMTPEN